MHQPGVELIAISLTTASLSRLWCKEVHKIPDSTLHWRSLRCSAMACCRCTRVHGRHRPTDGESRPPARQWTRRPATTVRGRGCARCGLGDCAGWPPRRSRSQLCHRRPPTTVHRQRHPGRRPVKPIVVPQSRHLANTFEMCSAR